MSGYCKDCGNQYCICDDVNSHPEIRKHKRRLKEHILRNPEDFEWKDVNDILPKESGRYWCYVEELNDLGLSYYQWNVSFNKEERRFNTESGIRVTHWMHLHKPPKVTK